ncbi:MAG: efflux RND transporter periplasmic adaptor subunit [Eubacterium sp.]|nr:efflux RND transporter periplasmic adaptor subunit [Eubacterium sp.]
MVKFIIGKYFNRRKIFHRVILWGFLSSVILFSSACSFNSENPEEDMDPLVNPRNVIYSSVEHNTTLVQKGDITPTFTGGLTLSGYQEEVYYMDLSDMSASDFDTSGDLGELLVSVGDKVSAGDTMYSFNIGKLNDQIEEKQEAKELAALDIQHYQNLMAQDSSLDYSEEIKKLNNDIKLADTYISDIKKKKSEIDIVARVDGYVSYVDISLLDGWVTEGVPVIRTVKDDGYYTMKNPINSNAEEEGFNTKREFHIGEVFEGKSSLNEYKMEVIPDPTLEDGNEGAQSGELVTSDEVYFKSLGQETIKDFKINLYTELPEKKNVCYVEKSALVEYNSEYYVYKEKDGQFLPVKVKVGDLVGLYVIIEEGLEEGDVVSLSE